MPMKAITSLVGRKKMLIWRTLQQEKSPHDFLVYSPLMLACQENFPDDGRIAAEINRKLNLGEANTPCFFCELKYQYYNNRKLFFKHSYSNYHKKKE
jgi:hypothetical protein